MGLKERQTTDHDCSKGCHSVILHPAMPLRLPQPPRPYGVCALGPGTPAWDRANDDSNPVECLTLAILLSQQLEGGGHWEREMKELAQGHITRR